MLASAGAEVGIPSLTARVTDLTSTLNPQQRDALEQKLAAFEAVKGSQIAVLIVPTTQPEAIEQYSIRVVEQWKLGRKGVDDGALLLVAKDDRKMRLEVGRGLEGAVPDAVAKRITADIIAPYFKRGDFGGGITAGVERLIKVVEGEPLPEPAGKSQLPRREWEDSDSIAIGVVLVTAIAAMVIGGFLRARLGLFGCAAGSTVLGGAVGGAAWAMTGMEGYALFVFLAICIFILGLFGGALAGDVGGGRGWSWGWLGRFGVSAGLGGAIGGAAWAITQAAEAGIFFAIVGFLLGMQDFRGALSGGSSSGRGWSGGSSGGSSGGGFSGGGGDFGGGGASSSW
ncbi:MAG: YgcG family protein [Burkholderiales bacterium]|nr:YgcG family protein [Burkholderiales bacterium]